MTRYRGDTYNHVEKIQDTLFNTPILLTDISSVSLTYSKQSGNVIQLENYVVDDIERTITFTVQESDFDTAGTFSYDIQVTYTDGTKRTIVKDKLEILYDVNKY